MARIWYMSMYYGVFMATLRKWRILCTKNRSGKNQSMSMIHASKTTDFYCSKKNDSCIIVRKRVILKTTMFKTAFQCPPSQATTLKYSYLHATTLNRQKRRRKPRQCCFCESREITFYKIRCFVGGSRKTSWTARQTASLFAIRRWPVKVKDLVGTGESDSSANLLVGLRGKPD